jgi:ubiquinone/menaquinone biosynthesis C-methylase UbiE
MNSKTQNPWLQISAEDYEGHMSAPKVAQLQMLNKIFADVLNEFQPKSVAVLGCTTGNGFEHLINKNIVQIVGVDLNPQYISICKKRFEKSLPQLELICADLNQLELQNSSLHLIHAALIFEYVDIDKVLLKILRWLKPDGMLTAVLQLQSDKSSPVSETPYKSLRLLNSFIKLVEPEELRGKAKKCGLEEVKNYKIKLESGKSFLVNKYVRKD